MLDIKCHKCGYPLVCLRHEIEECSGEEECPRCGQRFAWRVECITSAVQDGTEEATDAEA